MTKAQEIVDYCDELLQSERYRDYCPNGLQVQGRTEVRHIVSGVTASQALIDAAIEAGADLLLVHHGYFWKGEDATITGIKQKRISALLGAELGLLAYHLPLDAHPELGNNAQLARMLGFDVEGILNEEGIGQYGSLRTPMSLDSLSQQVGEQLGRAVMTVSGGDHEIRRIGWCTGAAQGYIDQAADLGLDAYLSGEISEQTVHIARERGIHYLSAGHHATERLGVQALGQHLAEQFGISYQFIDIDNPV
jgi:dinuclear metal center YbgI/SA1388 family protein